MHTMEMTADPNYQEGRQALIECHGSLHRSACVQKIELVLYIDTKQAYGQATGQQQEIRLESASSGGGGRAKKRKKAGENQQEMGVAAVRAHISDLQTFTVMSSSPPAPRLSSSGLRSLLLRITHCQSLVRAQVPAPD